MKKVECTGYHDDVFELVKIVNEHYSKYYVYDVTYFSSSSYNGHWAFITYEESEK